MDDSSKIRPDIEPTEEKNMGLAPTNQPLNQESLTLLNKIINETDEQKTKDLTYLFNRNQDKKTLIRVNKLSDLLDVITDQALERFKSKPDEISNKELFDGLKVVQDLIERGQKQVADKEDVPLIQVNQQNNEVNIGDKSSNLSRESRERVKSAILSLLNNINTTDTSIVEDKNNYSTTINSESFFETTPIDITYEEVETDEQ